MDMIQAGNALFLNWALPALCLIEFPFWEHPPALTSHFALQFGVTPLTGGPALVGMSCTDICLSLRPFLGHL